MTRQLTLAATLLLALTGCASFAPPVSLSDAARKVVLFENAELPERCAELATIEVAHGTGCGSYGKEGNAEDALRLFKNRVAERGGNAGVVQTRIPPHAAPFCYVKEYKIRGYAFDCPGS
jgi:hypothetical protein